MLFRNPTEANPLTRLLRHPARLLVFGFAATILIGGGLLSLPVASRSGASIAFIDAHQREPFFVYLPLQNPHTPFQAKRSDWDAFPDEKDPIRRTYLALIRSLDTSVGRVMKALDERHLSEDTLVIFLSDNGAALYTHATTNGPLQGGKFTLFEEIGRAQL